MDSMIRHLLLASLAASVSTAHAQWSDEIKDGVVKAGFGGANQLAYQIKPLKKENAEPAFLPSAFLHPITTPSGFAVTAAMPADHIHHLGLWWPWKFIEVRGKKANCWELQFGEGAHRAVDAKILTESADAVEWELRNEIRIRTDGENAGPPATEGTPVIRETVRLRAARHGKDANVIDIEIRQDAIDAPVTILNYRYSGFCWRGPEAWNATNSVMTTDRALGRDQANGAEGRWVLVTGPNGASATASVLTMSAAVDLAGTAERLRVWGSKNHHGTPFVNFNPVQQSPLPLNAETPAVSHRQYRVIAADRTLTAGEAEAEWQAWRQSGKR